jgi:DNA-binding MarR family transcriptional regulator
MSDRPRDRTESETWRDLRSLVLDRNDRRRTVAEALGLSFVRVKALIALRSAPRAMRDLATTLGIDAPYTTVIVDDLEARGLVTRGPHPDDRRAKLVALTAAGRTLAQRAERLVATPPASLRTLSDADLRELHRITRGLLDAEG